MTENEAKEYMENEVECIKRASHCDRDCLNCELVKEEEPLIESYGMAIQAIEEIQQYRAIGTIEEFKALKEKIVAKKPILNNPKINEFYIKEAKLCPACHSYINNCSGDYCRDCGQKLDWSE